MSMNFVRFLSVLILGAALSHITIDIVPTAIAQAVVQPSGAAQPSLTLPGGIGAPPVAYVVPATVAPDPSTKFSTGTLADQAIQLLILAFGASIAAAFVAIAIRVLTWLGVKNAEQYRDRLQKLAETGLALGKEEAKKLDGTGVIDVKSRALQYVLEHGQDTLKSLGVDPNDPKTIEALQARIAKAMQDAAADQAATDVHLTNPATAKA